MADPLRFPRLALPFAIVGAAAGWLSAGLVDNELVGGLVSRPGAAICASLIAAATGALIKRLCVGRRYWYEIGEPDPELRPWSDRGWLQAVLVILAGALTGGIVGCKGWGFGACAVGGALCAITFVPVCLAVVAAARRAQRGRLGSLVAEADRREVWAILALTLAVTTLEALPEWPASTVHEGGAPVVVIGALLAVAAAIFAILHRDHAALARARETIDAGLSAHQPTEVDSESEALPRLDLGLGDDLRARVTRGAAAYRQRERTVALVRGDPGSAMLALRRAVRRGQVSLAALAVVALAHVAALSTPALVAYEVLRCNDWSYRACSVAADLLPEADVFAPLRRRAALDPALLPIP